MLILLHKPCYSRLEELQTAYCDFYWSSLKNPKIMIGKCTVFPASHPPLSSFPFHLQLLPIFRCGEPATARPYLSTPVIAKRPPNPATLPARFYPCFRNRHVRVCHATVCRDILSRAGISCHVGQALNPGNPPEATNLHSLISPTRHDQ